MSVEAESGSNQGPACNDAMTRKANLKEDFIVISPTAM